MEDKKYMLEVLILKRSIRAITDIYNLDEKEVKKIIKQNSQEIKNCIKNSERGIK